MLPIPKYKIRDIIDTMGKWVSIPFVIVGFLIHVFGVSLACIGYFITDGINGVKEFWNESI